MFETRANRYHAWYFDRLRAECAALTIIDHVDLARLVPADAIATLLAARDLASEPVPCLPIRAEATTALRNRQWRA